MVTMTELSQRRAKMIAAARALLADAGARELTPNEARRADKLLADADQLKARIDGLLQAQSDRVTRLEAMESELKRPEAMESELKQSGGRQRKKRSPAAGSSLCVLTD